MLPDTKSLLERTKNADPSLHKEWVRVISNQLELSIPPLPDEDREALQAEKARLVAEQENPKVRLRGGGMF